MAEAQLARYPNIGLVDDRVLAIEPIGPGAGFRATVGRRTTTATGVVLANGVNDDPMPIPGVAEHWGRGVFTCPFCDGWEHRDLHLAVIGDPAFAPHTGQLLTGWSDRVTVFCDLDADVVERLAGFGVAVDDRPVARVLGDGEQTRDFTYIDNVVLANMLAATSEKPLAGEVVNIGTGARIRLLDVLKHMGEALKVDSTPTFGPPRAGDVRHSSADITQARALLGYEPVVDFGEGIRRTLEWARAAK